MRIAVFNAQQGLGDAVAHCFPLCKLLKQQGHYIEFWQMNRKVAIDLASSLPYVDAIDLFEFEYVSDTTKYSKKNLESVSKMKTRLCDIDEFYLFASASKEKMELCGELFGDETLPKIVDRRYTPYIDLNPQMYDPERWFKSVGKEFKQEYMLFDLDWFKDFYKDFGVKKNTVLLNCASAEYVRTYIWGKELKASLEEVGFHVVEFDYDADIRTNLFLLNSVPYILTVPTSTIYLAYALGRHDFYTIVPDDLIDVFKDHTKDARNKRIPIGSPREITDEFCNCIGFPRLKYL